MSDYEYTDIKNLIQKNKHKKFDEWLEFVEIFKNPGKQGLAGVLKIKEIDKKVVFKISQYINYLPQHEYYVMDGLNKIHDYCPHFCQSFGIIRMPVNPRCKKYGNPFIKTDEDIEKDILLLEYIDNASKLYNYIQSSKKTDDIIYSAIKQVLLGISMAQNYEFAHYDLHALNIMMKKCDKNMVFLYVLDDKNQVAVPTYGYYPVIIDYGFSFIKSMNGNPMWQSMAHTSVGFMSDRFDNFADPKLFLVSVSNDLKYFKRNKNAKKFRNIVRNIFKPLTIDWESGWDDVDNTSASEYVLELIAGNNIYSKLFLEYDYYCLDVISSLITLPIKKQNYGDIDKSYKTFLIEFSKIEEQLSSNFYNLYILKGIVDSAREIKTKYMNIQTRDKALFTFSADIYNIISKIADFCNPEINYEKMLCSLYVFASCVEGVFYDVMKNRMENKQLEYNKLELKNPIQMVGCLEVNIPSEYVYSTDTVIIVLNQMEQKISKFKLENEQDVETVNSLHSLSRGSYLYKLIC